MADSGTTSISAAAQQYQEALHKYEPRRESTTQALENPPATNGIHHQQQSVVKEEQQQSPLAISTLDSTSSPAGPVMGQGGAARHTTAVPVPAAPMPTHAVEHGAPFRRYLNTKVTPSLLEGMKQLGTEQPKDPLKFLGEFLLKRSKELEGT